MDIQKRIVFTVELEFTFPSQILKRDATCFYFAFFFCRLPLFLNALFVPEESCRRFLPVPLGGGQTIPYPSLIRCSPEPKVIGLQDHAAFARLVQQHRQPNGTRRAFTQAAQKKILRDAALQHCTTAKTSRPSRSNLFVSYHDP